jgi:dinuclear metal center YbgI/SA1388 family protein
MKKATVKNISDFLNRTLRVKKIHDASVNGLQVRSRNTGVITKIGFAVDACISTFEKAQERGVDLLVVHHGIKWKPQKDRVLAQKRTVFLKKHDIALYAVHLPLDLHEEYGNNVQLARILGLRRLRRFGAYHGIKIGYAGTFSTTTRPQAVAASMGRHLLSPCRTFLFGKDRVRTIGIVSGGGGGLLNDAVKERLDCFLVGEMDLAVYNAAKDHGMNVLSAGHYATETVGVKALMPVVGEAFGVETVFIEDRKKL